MSHNSGGQQPPPPPQDPYYGGQPPSDPYGYQGQAGQDPYYGSPPPADPYAPPPDPYYGTPPADGAPPQGQQGPAQQPGWGAPPPPPPEPRKSRGGSGAAIVGVLLVIVGVWVLFGDQLELDIDWSEIWPVVAVIVGALMVLASVLPGRGRDNA